MIHGRWYLTLEIDREADGRFIAELPDLPGVFAYGATKEEEMRYAIIHNSWRRRAG